MSKMLARVSAVTVLVFAVAAHAVSDSQGSSKWFSAWTISVGHRMGPTFTGANFAPNLTGQTVRMIVRPNIAGNAVRVRVENTQATTPVVFSGAFIGQVASGAAVVPGTNVRLTFGGSAGLTLAAGASAYSDPVKFKLDAFQRLAISLQVASATEVRSSIAGK